MSEANKRGSDLRAREREKVPRMRGEAARIVYQFLVGRDGEKCWGCSRKRNLVVDHKDGNVRNNAPQNLRLACRRHNWFAERQLTGVREREKVGEDAGLVERGSMSKELEASRDNEPLFRSWMLDQIMGGKEVTFTDAMYGGAEFVGCSPAATYRYLKKMLSDPGPLELLPGRPGHQRLAFKEG